ncbi:MAG: galactose mutarotase [Clostridia bacterium]|nr:galactose mutarotase [Clostridia bacterium]
MITKTYSFEKEGKINDVYTLENENGFKVEILTYGARILSIYAPDKNGVLGDCIVGCKTPEDYYGKNCYFGATIGRYGNRIGGAAFTLNGVRYGLEANDNGNTLHGGSTTNFDRVIWGAEIAGDTLILSHVSPDGAGGFPGEMKVKVSFTVTNDNAIRIDYEATTDKDTPCNLTNHSYFNIGSQDTVLAHELMIKSRKMTAVDKQLIPHGELTEIDGTPYSFFPAKLLGKDMFSDAEMIKHCNGFDFNYCIERETEKDLEHFAYVYDSESGRRMDCYTTLPGVQLYTACSTGNGGYVGKKEYVNHCALCLETQGYPNSPNCPQYPSTILKAGETYRETTVYKFSVVK